MIAGHPHTVRDSHVPLYMQGFPRLGYIGQDGADVPIEPSVFDPGTELAPSVDFAPSSITVPFLPQTSDLPGMDPSIFDPGSSLIAPPNLEPNTQVIANMYAGAVASGSVTPSQAASATNAAISAAKGITPFIFSKGDKPALGPGPSPRVGTRPPASASVFTDESIKGVPNWVLLAGGGLLLFAAMGKR